MNDTTLVVPKWKPPYLRGVNVNFTVPKLRPLIMSGAKRQTIRKYSPYWMKVGPGTLCHLFWKMRTTDCVPLNEGLCVYRSPPLDWQHLITPEIAKHDGFDNIAEMESWFTKKYKAKTITQQYVLLRWNPLWLPKDFWWTTKSFFDGLDMILEIEWPVKDRFCKKCETPIALATYNTLFGFCTKCYQDRF